jgi:hypothetical protein
MAVFLDVYEPSKSAIAILPSSHIIDEGLEARIVASVRWHKGHLRTAMLGRWLKESTITKPQILKPDHPDHEEWWRYATGRRANGEKTDGKKEVEEYWAKQEEGKLSEQTSEQSNAAALPDRTRKH